MIKPQLHGAYRAFLRDLDSLDDGKIWERHYSGGNLSDHAKVPFILLTSSDDAGCCIQNGYLNTVALTDEIVNAPAAQLLDFLDEWAEAHDQVL